MSSRPTVSSILVRHFSIIPDPRKDRRKLHKLFDILVITLCGMIAHCDSWEDLEFFAQDKEEWFRSFLELPNGIPSHDTFERVFERLEPRALQGALVGIAEELRETFTEEIVAIDGKTVRGSADKRTRAIHTVSAYAVENGLTLAQVATDTKSNEITAIPELLDLIDVKGAIVTIDAMGCQKSIAAKILDKKGDYVLALKGNQGNLHDQVKTFFSERTFDELENLPSTSVFKTVEKGHGRIEERTYAITSDIAWIEGREHWKGLQSIGIVEGKRTIGEKKTTVERRYFIGSIDPDSKLFARGTRGHWGIEANHWTLDVTFREDQLLMKRGHAPENLSILRKMALNLVKKDKESKRSLIQRRRQAARSTSYLQKILEL
jgi:predicted transposase YbfD/YdcC